MTCKIVHILDLTLKTILIINAKASLSLALTLQWLLESKL